MRQIVDSIGLSAVGEELMSLWMEYEEGTCIGTDHGMHVVTLLLPSQLVLQYLGLFAYQRVFMRDNYVTCLISAEAEVARQLDKFEMIIQADEYEREQGMRLESFFRSTKDSFTHPEVRLG